MNKQDRKNLNWFLSLVQPDMSREEPKRGRPRKVVPPAPTIKRRGRPPKAIVEQQSAPDRYVVKNRETGEYLTASDTWSKLLGNAKIFNHYVPGAIEI